MLSIRENAYSSKTDSLASLIQVIIHISFTQSSNLYLTGQARSMEWDLSVIFHDTDALEKQMEQVRALADELATYKGKIEQFTVEELRSFVDNLEDFYEKFSPISQYPGLRVAANQNDKEALELRNTVTTFSQQINSKLAFVSLEIGKLLVDQPDYLEHEVVKDRKYYLERIYQNAKYRLSEAEEIIIIDKNRYGLSEWSKLQGELVATTSYKIEIDEELKEYSWSEGNSLKSSPNPEVRRAAFKGLNAGLRQHGKAFAYALRNVCGDYVTEARRRGYEDLMESSLVYNHLNREIIDAMFKALLNSKHIIKKYYDVKAKLLGFEKLEGVDFFAPLPFSSDRKIGWEEAKKTVIDGFTDFDPEFGEIAADMFANNRVDAKPRDGKRAGAFCSTWRSGDSAFIMMSYNEDMDSLGTLAHEMGHAVHAYQSTPRVPITLSNFGMSLAETASEFGSLLFNLKFMKEAKSEEEKKAVLFNMVENFMIVFYEVGTRTLFETKLYDAAENNVLLTEEKIDELYKASLSEMFGDTINWSEENLMHWLWKGHYYIPGLRYYNYPYVFGEFSVLAMYAKYREDPKGFTEGYKNFLRAGGSRHPHEMFKDLFGFDLASDEFWEGGIKELENFVEQCQNLA